MFWGRIRGLRLWKRRPVQILAVITFLFLLPCIIKIIQPNTVYRYDGEYVFEAGTVTDNTEIYEPIALKPGVYRVEWYYSSHAERIEEPAAYVNMADSTVIRGGLRTNGVHLYAGVDRADYTVWLYESTENIQMTVSCLGNGEIRFSGYCISETNQLWSMLITVVLFFAALVFAVMVYIFYDREYPVAVEKKKIFFFVTLIGLFASLPYFYGGNIAGIDLTYHMHRIEGVKDGLFGGQFPVRIEPRWLYGHGYPAAVFYCNGLLYFPALLRMLGFTTSASYNIYCIAITMAAAWIAYWCFSRIFQDADVGILCCALYTLSAFRIYKLVNTCAVGEGSAVTFMPVVLYGMYSVFTGNPGDKRHKTAWIFIAAGYAGLIQTHVLTCEITAALTIMICLVCIKKIFVKEIFWELAKGALGALGLSLWFLVPFLDFYLTQNVHIKNLSARTIQQTGLSLVHHTFQFWREGIYTPNGETGAYMTYPVGVGFILILGLCVFFALWLEGGLRREAKGLSGLAAVSAAAGILLLFMSTRLFPWDYIGSICPLTATLVSSLEFTHRVLGWGTLFLVTVCGFCLAYFKKNARYCYLAAAGVTAACVVISGSYLMDSIWQAGRVYTIYNEEGMGFGFVSDGEYLPEGTDTGRLTFRGNAVAGEGVLIERYEKDNLKVEMSCTNDSEGKSYVEIPLLYYKGYRAEDARSGSRLEICGGDNNVIRVMLEKGFSGDIKVRFVSPFYWRLSELVSAASVLFFLFWIWGYRRGNKGC